jgi:hypothetical protein
MRGAQPLMTPTRTIANAARRQLLRTNDIVPPKPRATSRVLAGLT